MRWSAASGQATVETVGLALAVAAAAGGLAIAVEPAGVRLAGAIRAALAGRQANAWASLPAPVRSIAVAAVDGAPGAPTVSDAVSLITAEAGAPTATSIVADLARSRLAPRLWMAAPGGWARPRRGPIRVRIVTPAEERRMAPLVRQAASEAADRRLALGLLATGVGVVFGPEAGFAADLVSLAVPGPGRALPAGTRAGDLLLAIPVLWRPRPGRAPRTAEHAACLLAVVRAGRALTIRIAGAARC